MRSFRFGRPAVLVAGVLGMVVPPAVFAAGKAGPPKSRTFLFTYATTVTGLAPGKVARVWLPVPSSTTEQDVQVEAKELPPGGHLNTEPTYGNWVLHFEAKADDKGSIPLSVTYRVTRREVVTDAGREGKGGTVLARYLQPDAKVPVGGKPLDLIKDKDLPDDPAARARALYDVVNNHMKYGKDMPGWGQGDANWACDSKTGNCSDFHSLFISLARAQKMPAKFEIGFPLPPKAGEGDIPGYHCWGWFYLPMKGWVPVDISEANKNPMMRDYYFGNLTADRVAFSTGRDITLVPRQDDKPLNFFIYPYVEVDGKPYPADKVKNKWSYKDVEAGK